jgi:NADP-dependent 3-hydroxy acid dehydrogenase YdfG
VTGGASGIGEATCRALTAAGAEVTIADFDLSRAESLATQLPGATVLAFDIADETAVRAALSGVESLDVLLNNVGIGMVGSIEETEAADFDRLLRVNVRGTYLVTRALLPKLFNAAGSAVNIGSVAGVVGIKRRFAYCATPAKPRWRAVDHRAKKLHDLSPGHRARRHATWKGPCRTDSPSPPMATSWFPISAPTGWRS